MASNSNTAPALPEATEGAAAASHSLSLPADGPEPHGSPLESAPSDPSGFVLSPSPSVEGEALRSPGGDPVDSDAAAPQPALGQPGSGPSATSPGPCAESAAAPGTATPPGSVAAVASGHAAAATSGYDDVLEEGPADAGGYQDVLPLGPDDAAEYDSSVLRPGVALAAVPTYAATATASSDDGDGGAASTVDAAGPAAQPTLRAPTKAEILADMRAREAALERVLNSTSGISGQFYTERRRLTITPHEEVDRAENLAKLRSNFVTTTEQTAKEVAHAYHAGIWARVNDRRGSPAEVLRAALLSVRPNGTLVMVAEGVAGGVKVMDKTSGVFYKISDDLYNLYGGSSVMRDKPAKHELAALTFLHEEIDSPHLTAPLASCIDVTCREGSGGARVYRVQAFSALPIGATTLRLGSADGGSTLHLCEAAEPIAASLAAELHLAPSRARRVQRRVKVHAYLSKRPARSPTALPDLGPAMEAMLDRLGAGRLQEGSTGTCADAEARFGVVLDPFHCPAVQHQCHVGALGGAAHAKGPTRSKTVADRSSKHETLPKTTISTAGAVSVTAAAAAADSVVVSSAAAPPSLPPAEPAPGAAAAPAAATRAATVPAAATRAAAAPAGEAATSAGPRSLHYTSGLKPELGDAAAAEVAAAQKLASAKVAALAKEVSSLPDISPVLPERLRDGLSTLSPLPFDVEMHILPTGERCIVDTHRLLVPEPASNVVERDEFVAVVWRAEAPGRPAVTAVVSVPSDHPDKAGVAVTKALGSEAPLEMASWERPVRNCGVVVRAACDETVRVLLVCPDLYWHAAPLTALYPPMAGRVVRELAPACPAVSPDDVADGEGTRLAFCEVLLSQANAELAAAAIVASVRELGASSDFQQLRAAVKAGLHSRGMGLRHVARVWDATVALGSSEEQRQHLRLALACACLPRPGSSAGLALESLCEWRSIVHEDSAADRLLWAAACAGARAAACKGRLASPVVGRVLAKTVTAILQQEGIIELWLAAQESCTVSVKAAAAGGARASKLASAGHGSKFRNNAPLTLKYLMDEVAHRQRTSTVGGCGWAELLHQIGSLSRLSADQQHLGTLALACACGHGGGSRGAHRLGILLSNLSSAVRDWGMPAEALGVDEATLSMLRSEEEPRAESISALLNNVGGCYEDLGMYEKAIECYEESLALKAATIGERHSDYATTLNNLALAHARCLRLDKALELLQQCRTIRRDLDEVASPAYSVTLNNVAQILLELERPQDALPVYEEALAIKRAVYGEGNPQVATTMCNYAACLRTLGRQDEAAELYRAGTAIMTTAQGRAHPERLVFMHNSGMLEMKRGRFADAEAAFRDCAEAMEEAGRAGSREHSTELMHMASAIGRGGDIERALTVAFTAHEALLVSEGGTGETASACARLIEQLSAALA
ncbi:hypothetical protein FNF27_07780 [Cafeteria roenbergensis]|uniref:Clu domain-containing protein n=1 Tax=Cafeteria roenbergensis TaxID=33653 RepID=A0A5A8DHS9_CAFRO|nr:hypothetical protein FNF27_07780 [Cafeteria roenbergensis]